MSTSLLSWDNFTQRLGVGACGKTKICLNYDLTKDDERWDVLVLEDSCVSLMRLVKPYMPRPCGSEFSHWTCLTTTTSRKALTMVVGLDHEAQTNL
jgi:hypothetical protein